ncbi:hypothetical protein LTR09_002004 [Extremus antarcticus]|uniref:Uncharacterized protein n=1 Tax=Extremus antarcticus TaxID=702011 RepID=A0AAJ0GG88_9PEZI|nr:hypothetical protein LTR09_002004 [Extremus antarcticus]
MQTSIAAGQQPADYYQQDAAPTPNQGVLTQQPAGSQNRSQHSQSMPDTASAGPVQAVPSHINAMSEHRQDGRSRPQSEIAPESSVSQQASRQSRGRASRQAEGIAPKAPSRARSVRGEVRGYHNPGETFLSASNEPLQPQAHARNRLPQDEFQGGIRPPLRQGLVRGEADDYYDPNQNFSTAAPSRVNARPQPQAPNPAEQRTDGAEHQHGRRRHRHRHRRPIDQEDHEYFIARSTIPRGPLGYVKGLLHLLLNKSHVKDHTAERLDLLNRARKYFNSGLISSVPGFKEKKGRFEEEMCVVTETLLYQERERSRASRTGDHTNHEHDRFGRLLRFGQVVDEQVGETVVVRFCVAVMVMFLVAVDALMVEQLVMLLDEVEEVEEVLREMGSSVEELLEEEEEDVEEEEPVEEVEDEPVEDVEPVDEDVLLVDDEVLLEEVLPETGSSVAEELVVVVSP